MHLCVILIEVDKSTPIASSLANEIPWPGASSHTQLVAQLALRVICVVVDRARRHTLSAIVASDTVTSCIVDNPEVTTCLALKWALHAEELTRQHPQQTHG